jgi:hypothetical protein
MPKISVALDEEYDDTGGKKLHLKVGDIEGVFEEPLYDLRIMPEFEAALAPFFQHIINVRDGTTIDTPSTEAIGCADGFCRYLIRDLAWEYSDMEVVLDTTLEMFIKREFPTLE